MNKDQIRVGMVLHGAPQKASFARVGRDVFEAGTYLTIDSVLPAVMPTRAPSSAPGPIKFGMSTDHLVEAGKRMDKMRQSLELVAATMRAARK